MRKGRYARAFRSIGTLGVLGAGIGVLGAGISACGTGPASAANVGTLPPVLTQQQQRVLDNKGYLPIYAQFSNKVTPLGYPITVPDAIRVPLPQILAKEIGDTASPTVNGVWVGTGTPQERMAIYTAKVFDAQDAYLPSQALYNPSALSQERSLNTAFASSTNVLNKWLSANPGSFFYGDNQGTVYRNGWLISERILTDKTPTLSPTTPVSASPMTVGVCASMGGVGVTNPANKEFDATYKTTTTINFVVTEVPSSDLSHVWKVSQFTVTTMANAPC